MADIDIFGGAHNLIPVIVFGIAARGLLFLVIAVFVLLAGGRRLPIRRKDCPEQAPGDAISLMD